MHRKDRKLAEMYGMIVPWMVEKPLYESCSTIGKAHPTKKAQRKRRQLSRRNNRKK